jgi:hypothetical protein
MPQILSELYQVAVKEVICHAERNAVKRSISEILRYAQNDMIERNSVLVVEWAVQSKNTGLSAVKLTLPPYMLQLSERSLLNSPLYPVMAIVVD